MDYVEIASYSIYSQDYQTQESLFAEVLYLWFFLDFIAAYWHYGYYI